jgi:hypothetical protein
MTEEERKKKRREYMAAYRARKGIIKCPGVGKGGNQKHGADNPQYKNGSRYYQNNRRVILKEREFCERCGEYLVDLGPQMWVVHHKDHDRTNNVYENFELLCKRCHQVEHKCWEAFEGATTIRKE